MIMSSAKAVRIVVDRGGTALYSRDYVIHDRVPRGAALRADAAAFELLGAKPDPRIFRLAAPSCGVSAGAPDTHSRSSSTPLLSRMIGKVGCHPSHRRPDRVRLLVEQRAQNPEVLDQGVADGRPHERTAFAQLRATTPLVAAAKLYELVGVIALPEAPTGLYFPGYERMEPSAEAITLHEDVP